MPIKKYFKALFSISFISASALYSQLSVAADIKPNAVVAADAQLVQVSDKFEFTEGPAVDKAGNVYFTDQPNNKIYLWKTDNSIELFMTPSGRANGLFIDEKGNILACADENNQLWKISPDKNKMVLLDEVNNKAFNGPNDVWVSGAGHIYFTDPYYQRDYWQRTEPELKEQGLYRLDKSGQLQLLDADFTKPNGIVGFNNQLYVADIGAGKTYVYNIDKNGDLSDKRVFTEKGSDGMTIDEQGNLYLTGKGVMVFNPQGEQIAHIPVDQPWTANVTFGGKHRKTLFITAMDSVYTLKMKVAGVK